MTTPAAIPLDVFACPLQGANLIEASAGTGKTWAICGLYLRLVLERGLEVQKILVVTFTISATAELRERIRERMVQVLARLQGRGPAGDVFTEKLLDSLRSRHALSDVDMIKRLEAAVQNFDEASIFTIHGFAKRALDDAPFAAGMPLSQELLADDGELLAATASDFWRRHVAAPGLSPALAAYLMAQKDSPERYARLLRRQAGKPLSRVIWAAGTEGDAAPIDTARLQAAHDAASAIWQSGREDVMACVTEGLPRLKANIHNAASVAKAFASWDQLLAIANAMSAPANLEKLDLLTPARMVPKKGQQPCAAHPFFDAAGALLAERDALRWPARPSAPAPAAPAPGRRAGATAPGQARAPRRRLRRHALQPARAADRRARTGAGRDAAAALSGGADRRVPGHRSAAVLDLRHAVRQRRVAAVPGGRPQAGDLQLPQRRPAHLPAGTAHRAG